MTESAAAVMVSDMLRDGFEDAKKVGDDSFEGTLWIEGNCRDFADSPLPMEGTAGYTFTQSGMRYFIHILAARIPES
jgi:hypothetical protein